MEPNFRNLKENLLNNFLNLSFCEHYWSELTHFTEEQLARLAIGSWSLCKGLPR